MPASCPMRKEKPSPPLLALFPPLRRRNSDGLISNRPRNAFAKFCELENPHSIATDVISIFRSDNNRFAAHSSRSRRKNPNTVSPVATVKMR